MFDESPLCVGMTRVGKHIFGVFDQQIVVVELLLGHNITFRLIVVIGELIIPIRRQQTQIADLVKFGLVKTLSPSRWVLRHYVL